MTTCIVICLKNNFVNTLHVFKIMYELIFLIYKSLISWKCFKYLFSICDGSHKNVQSNIFVGHIMFSQYYWHSNVNKSFKVNIGSKQNVDSIKTIYFKGRPSMVPHYDEAAFIKTILLLFSHNKRISHAFNLPWKIVQLFKCSLEI